MFLYTTACFIKERLAPHELKSMFYAMCKSSFFQAYFSYVWKLETYIVAQVVDIFQFFKSYFYFSVASAGTVLPQLLHFTIKHHAYKNIDKVYKNLQSEEP